MMRQSASRVCECCEREQRDGESGWVITRDGDDFCPTCYSDLMAALLQQINKLPRRIGLCPEHAPEFYYPLADDESLTCPQCSLEMVVYEKMPPNPAIWERITHGRHCTCSACAREDWTNPELAPCGMHGSSCPRSYRPLGAAGEHALRGRNEAL